MERGEIKMEGERAEFSFKTVDEIVKHDPIL